MSLILERASLGTLFAATVELAPGMHVILGAPDDGVDDLANVCAGLQRPRHGSVKLFGKEPWSSPGTRARIATLLRDEPPEAAGSVLIAVRRALALRGDPRDAAQLLAELGLATFGNTAPDRLPPPLRRRLLLGLALTHPSASCLVLVEPFSCPDQDGDSVLSQLRAHAERGSVVVVMTASVRDASRIGGDVLVLDRGRFVRRAGEPLTRELAPGGVSALEVSSPDARKLASLLALEPDVSGVEWHARGERLRVRGADGNSLALAVARAARSTGSRVGAITPVLPALDEVRGASLGLWRAAQDAAREAAAARYKAQLEAHTRAAAPAETESKPPEPGAGT
jgi:ABC-type multidrug transport system ATPase subunit